MVHYYITYARVEQITKRYSQREGKKIFLYKICHFIGFLLMFNIHLLSSWQGLTAVNK